MGTYFFDHVQSPLTKSDWHGEAANAAKRTFWDITFRVEAAADEAQDVHGFLESAYHKLHSCQKKLKEHKEHLDRSTHLRIDGTGKVRRQTVMPDDDSGGKGPLLASDDSADFYNREISRIMEDARDADRLLKWSLSQDPNGRDRSFTSKGVNSLEDARRARREAAKDARAFTKLAETDHRALTSTELKRATAYLRKHEGDPYFAEKVVTDLGARGTLAFWQRNADEPQRDDARSKTLAKLQKSMSLTLATASHSDSAAMKEWKHDVIRLGTKRFTDTNFSDDSLAPGRSAKGPYGFQIMSSLMRDGEFDKRFLKEYGKGFEENGKHVPGLIDFDKKAAAKGSLKDFWHPDGYDPVLNLGKGSDHGLDPMAGYMEALGHNSEAAQELFGNKHFAGARSSPVDPDLKYLLQDREWPNGDPTGSGKRGYGYDELGHALEAGALGRPYDEPELGVHKSAAGASIMHQAVKIVGEDSAFLDEKIHPGREHLSDSLAKMGAGYIDNLNWSASMDSQSPYGDEVRDAAFGSVSGEGAIKLAPRDVRDFMSVVGATEEGHHILSGAQQEYTARILDSDPGPGKASMLAIETGAENQGRLDRSRFDSIVGDSDEVKSEQARKLEEAATWKKYGIGQGGGVVSTGVESLVQGTTKASYAVPIVGSVAEAFTTEREIMIDRGVEREQERFDIRVDADVEKVRSDFGEAGRARSKEPLNLYLDAHPELERSDWFDQAEFRRKEAYARGSSGSL
ncbi:hypothetical protein ACIGW3_28950 [Streptomyces sp. NPDC053499]|uniref:hypothetical protein n=1 Tax=Streptomyces sp. NPDC053499 TaxID=3365707 RepID=UPI0037CD45A6